MSWFRRTPLDAARWVVIDCETSGLDAARDRLLSVGAVKVERGRIRLEDAFDARIRQETPSTPENIVIHGIGGDAQLGGRPLEEVTGGLAAFAAGGVPVAFHAPFDAAVLRRHGFRPPARWHDLAALAPALFPQRRAKMLDDWLAEFDIAPHARHDALGDAFVTAQLLLVVLTEAKRQGIRSVEDLVATQRGSRWLSP
jgi:DNA polymerase-3 subunit epsilon